jgi:hypothetical protein
MSINIKSIYFLVNGIMKITNVTFAFYNDICSRRDIAIQVAQNNDDGQHPVTTNLISVYNTSQMNLLFNGRPNLDVVDPSDCGGECIFIFCPFIFDCVFDKNLHMDCDGLKKNLLIDTDGTLFGQPASVFSEAEYLWGNF